MLSRPFLLLAKWVGPRCEGQILPRSFLKQGSALDLWRNSVEVHTNCEEWSFQTRLWLHIIGTCVPSIPIGNIHEIKIMFIWITNILRDLLAETSSWRTKYNFMPQTLCFNGMYKWLLKQGWNYILVSLKVLARMIFWEILSLEAVNWWIIIQSNLILNSDY